MKKLTLIFSIIVLCINGSLAQNEKLVSFGISVNPKWAVPNVANKRIFDGSNNLGYSIGVDIYVAPSKKIELKSGIYLSRTLLDYIDYTIIFGTEVDGGQIDQFSSYTNERHKISYLGIPIEGKLKLIGQENHVYVKSGIEVLFKINNASKILIGESGVGERELGISDFKEVSRRVVKLKLGLGYELSFLKFKKLYVEPQFEYALNHVFDEGGIVSDLSNNIRIIEWGILFGVKL